MDVWTVRVGLSKADSSFAARLARGANMDGHCLFGFAVADDFPLGFTPFAEMGHGLNDRLVCTSRRVVNPLGNLVLAHRTCHGLVVRNLAHRGAWFHQEHGAASGRTGFGHLPERGAGGKRQCGQTSNRGGNIKV